MRFGVRSGLGVGVRFEIGLGMGFTMLLWVRILLGLLGLLLKWSEGMVWNLGGWLFLVTWFWFGLRLTSSVSRRSVFAWLLARFARFFSGFGRPLGRMRPMLLMCAVSPSMWGFSGQNIEVDSRSLSQL